MVGMLFQVSSGYFVCPVVLSSRDGPVKTLVSALSSKSIKKNNIFFSFLVTENNFFLTKKIDTF